jgi:hypothetical protein
MLGEMRKLIGLTQQYRSQWRNLLDGFIWKAVQCDPIEVLGSLPDQHGTVCVTQTGG